MMRLRAAVVGVGIAAYAWAPAAAQVRVAQWNITNYCSDCSLRVADFANAIYGVYNGRSMAPDVLVAEEIIQGGFPPGGTRAIGQASVDNFLAILNGATSSPSDWAAAPYVLNGGDTGNAIFYRTSKVVWVSTASLTQNTGSGPNQPPRDTQRWLVRLYGYSSNGAQMYLYGSHMKAGSTQADQDRRTPEAMRIRNDAEALAPGSNFLFCADTNIQSSNQTAYQILIASMPTPLGQFFDPILTPGSWNNNCAFQIVHTQEPSTQMDDRHDQILISGTLRDGGGLDYIGSRTMPYSTTTWNDPNHSYRCWGNDGNTCQHPIATATNTMVGPSIATSLIATVEGNGHLPVYLDLQVPAKVGAPAAVDFGTVPVGSVATATIQVFNAADVARFSRDGTGAGIDVLDYTLAASAGFSAPAGPFMDAAGGGVNTHTLSMSTATPGMMTGTLTITSDDPDQPTRMVALSGNVVGAPCPCDWNHSGALDSQDFFDFLTDFFNGNADFNMSGETNSQDFFDFLTCFFNGCP